MRWWPFRRRDSGEPADPSPNTPTADGESPERGTATARPTGAWRQLPPLAATATNFSLTAPVQRLADTITPNVVPQVTAPEMTHARDPLGPTGSVRGLVTSSAGARHVVAGTHELRFRHAAPEPVVVADATPLRPAAAVATEPRSHLARSVGTSVQRLAAPPTQARPVDDGAPSTPEPPGRSSPLPAAAPRRMATRQWAEVTPTSPPAVGRPDDEPARAPRALEASTDTTPLHAGTSDAPGESAPESGDRPIRSIQRLAVSEPQDAPERHDPPALQTTRVIRRVGAPLGRRPDSMVAAVDRPAPSSHPSPADDRGPSAPTDTTEPTSARPPVPAVASPRPGVLPARPTRPLAAIGSSTHPDPAPDPTPSTARDAPILAAAPGVMRLPASPPPLTVVPPHAVPNGPSGPTGEEASDPAAAPVPVRRGIQRLPESVPASVRSELEPELGEELGDVQVHRGPEVGDAAHSISASAFTTGGEVFMPDWHGSLSSGAGRKVLRHELTHVAQQRKLGSELPSEDSTVGRALEAEARSVGGQGSAASTPVPARRLPASGPSSAQRLAGATPDAPAVPRPTVDPSIAGNVSTTTTSSPVGPTTSPAAQRAIVARVQAAAVGAGIDVAGPSPSLIAGGTPTATAGGSSPAADSPVVQRLPEAPPPAAMSPARTTPSPAAGETTLPTTGDRGHDIEELARQLYPRFRTRLRHDLLADRERSGRLFDAR